MIQDWGFNYIYLWQDSSITRVNMRDHSFKSVARAPIEDFESTAYDPTHRNTSGRTSEEGAWLCNLFERNLVLE